MLLKDLPPGMLLLFSILERVGSGLSLGGIAVVWFTFLCHPQFQKAINRMIIYASLGNIIVLVGTILARYPIKVVHDSNFGTPLCKFQAFLIQMFLPADACWTLCMAVNVFLSMKRRWNAIELRKVEKLYFLFSYGVPLVPALVFEFIKNDSKGPLYGDATLWCWVSGKWDGYRIGTFYAPVWVVIILTIGIYIVCGKVVRQRTKMMRDFKKEAKRITKEEKARIVSLQNNLNLVLPQRSPTRGLGFNIRRSLSISLQKEDRNRLSATGATQDSGSHHSVEITGGTDSCGAKWCLPSRILCTKLTAATPSGSVPASPTKKTNAMKENSAMLSYFKVACLFFIALMVTWVPSSANRVYSLVYPGEVLPTLEELSAFLLPLQGFFNSVIYIATSMPACRALWQQIRARQMNLDGVRNIMAGFPTESELVKKSPASKQSPFSFMSPIFAKMSPFPAKNSPMPPPSAILTPVQPAAMEPSPAPSRKQTRDVDKWGDDLNWQQEEQQGEEYRPQSNDTTLAPGSPVSTGPRTSVHWDDEHEIYQREYAPVKTLPAVTVSDEDEETALEDMLAAGPAAPAARHWSAYHEYYSRTHDSNV